MMRKEKIIDINVKMTKSHYEVLMKSLDLSSRLGCGQTYVIDEFLSNIGIKPDISRLIADYIREQAFPNFKSNESSYGVYNEVSPMDSKIAYDLIQTLRFAIKDSYPEHTIYHNNPIQVSNKELPIIVINKGDI